LYNRFHGDNPEWWTAFSSIKEIGELQEEHPPTEPPTPPPTNPPTHAATETLTAPTTEYPIPAVTEDETPTVSTTEPPTALATKLITITPATTARPTTAPSTAVAPTSTAAPASSTVAVTGFIDSMNMSEVAENDTVDDCYIVYYDSIYNMTRYGPRHPAGADLVFANCGGNGTDAYELFHGNEREYLLTIETLKVGVVKVQDSTTTTPVTIETQEAGDFDIISLEELAEHDRKDDCYVAFHGTVYDMTDYDHPAGFIQPFCGKDGTDAYSIYHEQELLVNVHKYAVGKLRVVDDEEQEKESDEFLSAHRRVTLKELQSHNQKGDCWIQYYKSVYDLSFFLHPEPTAVQDVIVDSCGADGTKDFVKVHPKALIKSFERLKIGEIHSGAVSAAMLVMSSTITSLLVTTLCALTGSLS